MTMNKRSVASVTLGLLLGSLLATLDSTIASTALPTIIGELSGIDKMTWVSSAYLLASAVVVPIVGKLADMYGRRRWYLLGMAVFMLGSALCGTSTNMTQLILFRGLQGIGGGMLLPVAQTIVGDIFPGETRVKMQGLFASLFALASILGPKVGGWIVESLHWRWVFYINLPLGVLAFLVIWASLKENVVKVSRSVDYLGAATIAGATVSLLMALDLGNRTYPWASWQIISLFAAAGVFAIAFVMVELRSPDPILPMTLFRDRVFAVCNALGFIVGAGMLGTLIFIPLFMQGVVGTGANQAGSALTPMMLAVILGSVVGTRLLLKTTYRAQLLTGGLIMVGGFLLLSRMTTATTQGWVQAYMAVTGLGLGFVMPTLTIAVQNSFPTEQRGVVTSAVAFARSMGSSLGVAIFGVLMNNRAAGIIVDGLNGLAAKLPAAAAGALAPMQQTAAQDPNKLFGLLLRPDAASAVPAPVREPLFGLLKSSLTESLQFVFLCALAVGLVSLVVILFIGPARMPRQAKVSPTVSVAD